jgi:hypothetical protein
LTTAAPPQETAGSPKLSAGVSSPPAVVQAVSNTSSEKADRAGAPSAKLRKRTGRELLAAVRETLARLARPKDEQLEAFVEELLFVRQELRTDDAMAGSQREYYTAKVESRLEQMSIQLKKRIARNKRLGKPKRPERIRGPEGAAENLGQRAAGVAPPVPPLMGNGPAGPRVGRQPNDDYGQHLVDLIQKTIAPSTWDVNGGLGTIYYWRPGRALVVRQTGEVHDNMGGVLDQLRRAGP